jgi:hypothetical protein
MNNRKINWHKIWNNRSIRNISNLDNKIILENLIIADGFDGGSGTGKISVEDWQEYINWLNQYLDIKPEDTIFEVGCGCGAFLQCFYNKNHIVSGIDYSQSLIEIAKKIMPDMDFSVNEALNLNTTKKYDIVCANSIFFYFPDYEYSRKVLDKMYEKSDRIIGVFDIPNMKIKNACEKERRSLIENYDEKYNGLDHLYFDKEWFLTYSEERKCNLIFLDQKIHNYGNSKYRFNCILIKK